MLSVGGADWGSGTNGCSDVVSDGSGGGVASSCSPRLSLSFVYSFMPQRVSCGYSTECGTMSVADNLWLVTLRVALACINKVRNCSQPHWSNAHKSCR